MKQKNNLFFIYLVKFIGSFCLLFYGTELVIGLSSPGNYYNPFVADHLNFVQGFRFGLLSLSKVVLSIIGFDTYLKDDYTLSLLGGKGIKMVYSCIGYGVLSFWIAFIFANRGAAKRKAAWMLGGCAALIVLNILRICLILVATNNSWTIPLGWDHHTWFNVMAYLLIFTLIFFYDRTEEKKNKSPQSTINTKTKKTNHQLQTSNP